MDRLHWHAHGVHALAFSGADGSVLVSGGQEDAVVFWQLLTRKKLFVPHLGSLGVFTVAPSANGRMYAAVCGDNSMFLIMAHDLRVARRVLGLKTTAPNVVKSFVGLCTSPPDARCLVLTGSANTLQWFNVDQDVCVLEVAFTPCRQFTSNPSPARIELPHFTVCNSQPALFTDHSPQYRRNTRKARPDDVSSRWKRCTRGWRRGAGVPTTLRPCRVSSLLPLASQSWSPRTCARTPPTRR